MLKLQLPRPAGKQPAAAQPQPERPQVPLLETDPAMGLTAEQAAQRMAAGLDNRAAASPTRSETEIIRDNIFTFFRQKRRKPHFYDSRLSLLIFSSSRLLTLLLIIY